MASYGSVHSATTVHETIKYLLVDHVAENVRMKFHFSDFSSQSKIFLEPRCPDVLVVQYVLC
jgi:hypothetical protein